MIEWADLDSERWSQRPRVVDVPKQACADEYSVVLREPHAGTQGCAPFERPHRVGGRVIVFHHSSDASVHEEIDVAACQFVDAVSVFEAPREDGIPRGARWGVAQAIEHERLVQRRIVGDFRG